jgi:UDP-2-acetamido-3-amino-2,3-dideoxy-glucuronate N-acetyltransferase
METARDLLLIGAGDWGKNLARCFEQLGALRRIVVTGPDEAAAIAARFPSALVSGSLQAALADPEVRKVVIATPSATHFELARAALSAGKHVLVEKPLCLKADHAEELVELAEARSCTLMVGHLLQYHPCVEQLRALLQAGTLGELRTITGSRLNLGKFRTDENALYSFAPHDVSLVLSLLNDRLPRSVRCVGGSWLKPGVADSTTALMQFPGEVLVQLHVSWLNPFKEQKLTIVGSQGMAVFDDTKPWPEKLVVYRDYLRKPRAEAEPQRVAEAEPLLVECRHFLEVCRSGARPRTDGREGLRVLRVLDMAQRSLQRGGEQVTPETEPYFAHASAEVEAGAEVGRGAKIWRFAHVMPGAKIGEGASLGQNVFVAGGAVVGAGCKVQNNVSIYEGVELEHSVFVGPSCVFTNVERPRAEVSQKHAYRKTRVGRGATLGANSTILCGVTLGRYCFVGAGAVVTRDVPDHALVVGNPARQVGWVGKLGQRLDSTEDGWLVCPASGARYRETSPGKLEEAACNSTT